MDYGRALFKKKNCVDRGYECESISRDVPNDKVTAFAAGFFFPLSFVGVSFLLVFQPSPSGVFRKPPNSIRKSRGDQTMKGLTQAQEEVDATNRPMKTLYVPLGPVNNRLSALSSSSRREKKWWRIDRDLCQ